MADILTFALAGLARAAAACPGIDRSVRTRLDAAAQTVDRPLLAALKSALETPAESDAPLLDVAREFGLTVVELLCVRLAMAAEEDLQIGHILTHLQAPLAARHATVGLLTHAFGEELGQRAVAIIGQGAAVRSGILQLSSEGAPLPERQVSVPLPLCFALQGAFAPWPGAGGLGSDYRIELGSTTRETAAAFGRRLLASQFPPVLVIRSGEPAEARACAALLCAGIQARPVLMPPEPAAGLAPWLFLNGAIPVFSAWLAPGERRPAPTIPLFRGSTIILSGADGEFESDGRPLWSWNLDVPPSDERRCLWEQYVAPPLAAQLAVEHRHSATRIATLAREARHRATLRASDDIAYEDVRNAARSGDSGGVGALAELVPDEVADAALVVPAPLRAELENLVARCRLRDRLATGLGPALRARYRPSVRVLFVGPSGTGKTLAASWLASRLGLPLYRVDLSAITSKYIGETEKNLSQLLARSEQNEVVLLFDEADSLFGKRTDVKDAHDRFANAQTNYLLQRMENYNGITLLTSNSRGRFDASFARRLDCILEFPAPGPEERRALWLAHLGDAHVLTSAELNQIAASAEVCGGQIRTAVLASAIAAAHGDGIIHYRHVVAGLQSEYRKLGRQLPGEIGLALAAAL